MMSKREFLKVGMGGTAALFFGSLLEPESVLGRSIALHETYLESSIHNYWMKLSYNNGLETRQTRRRLGLALRNLGAVHGFGLGYSFVSCFDQAIEAAYHRFLMTGKKPGSLFELIQMLYDEHLLPKTGPLGGQILFAMLFSLLRGRESSALGDQTYQSYLAYRAAVIAHKNAYKIPNDPGAVIEARKLRTKLLQEWQRQLKELVNVYARGDAKLNPNFHLGLEMFEGMEPGLLPIAQTTPRLEIHRFGPNLVVSWKGGAYLQQATDLRGPWTDTHKSSPATFDARQANLFFRAARPASPTGT